MMINPDTEVEKHTHVCCCMQDKLRQIKTKKDRKPRQHNAITVYKDKRREVERIDACTLWERSPEEERKGDKNSGGTTGEMLPPCFLLPHPFVPQNNYKCVKSDQIWRYLHKNGRNGKSLCIWRSIFWLYPPGIFLTPFGPPKKLMLVSPLDKAPSPQRMMLVSLLDKIIIPLKTKQERKRMKFY